MARKYDSVLYDEAALTTTGSPREVIMYQVRVGADAAHPESVTNNPYQGSVDAAEKMTVHGLSLDWDPDMTLADLQTMLEDSFLEIIVKSNRVFHAPLSALPQIGAFTGHYTQATAGDEQAVGRSGMVYMLRNKIEINGGDRFSLRLGQSQNMVAATSIRVLMLVDIEETG